MIRSLRAALLIAAAVPSVACAPRPVATPTACGSHKIASYIGREATPMVRAEIARASGAKAIRWIYPDSAVTMDFSEERLNVSLTKSNRIRGARCG